MFSNPDFFFEHWRINIQREAMQRRATVDMLSVSQFNVVFGEGYPAPQGGIVCFFCLGTKFMVYIYTPPLTVVIVYIGVA